MPRFIVHYTSMVVEADDADAAIEAVTVNDHGGGSWEAVPFDPTSDRLEYLRGQIDAECISYGEIAELQGLAASIDPGDVQLLQWAGVPEFACEQCGGDVNVCECEASTTDVRSHFPPVLGEGLSGRLTEIKGEEA